MLMTINASNPPTDLVLTDRLPLAENPAAVYLGSLAEGSRRTMRWALDTIAHLASDGQADAFTLPWAALRYQHTAALRSKLAGDFSPVTANLLLSALRGVLRQAWRLHQLTAEDYQAAASVENVEGATLPAGRGITPGELAAMLDACAADQDPGGVRDAAIIALLYSAGLRRAELARLDLEDYNAQTGELKVRGKRRKERLLPIEGGAAEALADWLAVRGDHAGALLCRIRKGGRLSGRLSTQAVWHIVQERAKAAGVRDVSPHDFRRTFVSDLLDAGADIAIVQRLAGHANVNTTARYDRRPEEAKRRAVRLLHVPYRRVLRSK